MTEEKRTKLIKVLIAIISMGIVVNIVQIIIMITKLIKGE